MILSAVVALSGMILLSPPKSFYDFTVKDIDGKPVAMKQFKGKVLLVVNVASKCGNTPQYKPLQELYLKHKDRGLVVLGFPANNFREQEPGTDAEIKEVCSAIYGVTFPMFSKISVKGDDEHALYKWLRENSDRPMDDVEWNFAKFLVGRDGKVVGRFGPKVAPSSEELQRAVEAALNSR